MSDAIDRDDGAISVGSLVSFWCARSRGVITGHVTDLLGPRFVRVTAAGAWAVPVGCLTVQQRGARR